MLINFCFSQHSHVKLQNIYAYPGLESNRACSAERLGLVAQTEPQQPNRLLGRTKPSPSHRVKPPCNPDRSYTATEPRQADPAEALPTRTEGRETRVRISHR